MPETVTSPPPEAPLQSFLANLPAPDALRIRTLAHAWQGGGGHLYIGKLAIRLLAPDGRGRAFTAATLHPAHGDPPRPTLELGRILLQLHGVGAAAWTEWCDERPELRDLGFDGHAKFPLVRLDAIADVALVRLAQGVRDLALMVGKADSLVTQASSS